MNFWPKAERRIYCSIPLRSDIPSYCSYWCETAYFIIFSEAAVGRRSGEYLVLKMSRKYLYKSSIFIKIAVLLLANSLWQILQTYSDTFRNMHFFMKQCKDLQKQWVGGALIVLAKYSKTVFDEVHFRVNLLHQNSIKEYEYDLEHWLGYLYFRWFVLFSNMMALVTFF